MEENVPIFYKGKEEAIRMENSVLLEVVFNGGIRKIMSAYSTSGRKNPNDHLAWGQPGLHYKYDFYVLICLEILVTRFYKGLRKWVYNLKDIFLNRGRIVTRVLEIHMISNFIGQSCSKNWKNTSRRRNEDGDLDGYFGCWWLCSLSYHWGGARKSSLALTVRCKTSIRIFGNDAWLLELRVVRVYSSVLKGLIKESSEKHSGHVRGGLVRQNKRLTVK